jgi:hypothetical protein
VNVADQELLRARWRRTLDTLALDQINRKDFAMSALARRLREVTVQLVLLPADPEANVVSINDSFASWLEGQRRVDLDGTTCALPETQRRTAHVVALVDTYGSDEPWGSYFAVHRSGAIEFGLGQRGGWGGQDRAGNPLRTIALTPTVARVWATLRLAAALQERHVLDVPLQLTVGVADTGGALLGALGDGWAEPDGFHNSVGPCSDTHLLWHLELPAIPDSSEARDIAYSIGDRFEDAWGIPQRRYLAHRGQSAGQLDPRLVR